MTEEQILKKYEEKLKEAYASANTKSKKKRIARDLITFSSLCSEQFGIDKEYEWDYDYGILELIEDYEVNFVNTIMSNTILFEEIFKKTVDTFIDIKFPFYKDYYTEYKRITDKEFQDILFSFLNSYDPKLLEHFKRMIDEGLVFGADLEDCQGFTYPFETLNKNLLFYLDYKNSVGTAAIVAHECGHCYETKNFYNTGAKNYFDKTFKTPYYEVSSKFFEYAFLNYLKVNNIYTKDTEMRLNIYYIDLLINSFNIELLRKMKQIEINEDGKVYLEDDTLQLGKELQERLNYYDIITKEDYSFNFRDAHIYGLGALLGIYLYQNYKADPKLFKKEFEIALLNYPYSNDIASFERVGITPEILTEGKVLRKVLEDSK